MSTDFYEEGGLRLRNEPAREQCFRVVRRDTESEEQVGTGQTARREAVHRHMANEITSIDVAAQLLIDFPDAPWELKMEIARQCWDESRHVAALHRRLKEMGGFKGEFPVSALEWCITSAIDNIAGRLATQNRTFEAGAMDVVGELARTMRDAGDTATAEVLEAILADEIQHVRFANRWIKLLAKKDPRVLLQVAYAVRFLDAVNDMYSAEEGETNQAGLTFDAPDERVPAVNIEDRKLAEFDDEEIRVVLEQAGFRSLANETGIDR